MRIAMVGTGYVGLVSGACFAEFGFAVTCVDTDAEKVARLQKGDIPIYEPGLAPLVAKQAAAGRLAFTTDLAPAVAVANAVFIAVGTPARAADGHADLSFVHRAARDIAAALDPARPTLVVTKSTVPVGTAREIEGIIRAERPEADFDVASNPEFLREGAAVADFMRPDRVVIGVTSPRAEATMRALYRPLYINETPMIVTTPETAEQIKYAANAFLATKITFINEMADLCEKTGANVQDVARGMGLDGRIGPKFLHAGPGYGGSCFPKDTLALAQMGRVHGAQQTIVEAVVTANDARQRAMADKVIAACGGRVQGARVAVLGLAFKPGTDDVRAAPALTIIPILQEAGARVAAFDPAATGEAARHLSGVDFAADPYAAAEGADALVIVTEWNEFRALDMARIGAAMRTRRLVDLRNIYKPADMTALGFAYTSIGRG
jgi:UDPglucose 6-dehydrogenase